MKKKHILYFIVSVLLLGGIFGVVYKKMNTIPQINIINVEEDNEIKSKKIAITDSKRTIHMSFDDVINSFDDITKNDYDSIFQNDFFGFLEELHEKYGAVFSLYVFYENEDQTFNLSDMSDKYVKEFKENSQWLKFGFHSLNSQKNYKKVKKEEAKNDYNVVINELIRITGSKDSIDRVPRLHNFAASKGSVEGFKEGDLGITGLLGPDDKRLAYDLNKEQTSYLYLYDFYENDEINYYKTDMRLENIEDIKSDFDKHMSEIGDKDEDILVIFTHEYLLKDNENIKTKIEDIFNLASEKDYVFDYLR